MKLLLISVLLVSTFCFAQTPQQKSSAKPYGGNTSGGGSIYGIKELYPAVKEAEEWVKQLGSQVYSRRDLRKLDALFAVMDQNHFTVQALSADDFKKQFSATTNGVSQAGSIYSSWFRAKNPDHDSVMFSFNTDQWASAQERSDQIITLSHEFNVLTKIEGKGMGDSGDYHVSSQRFAKLLRKEMMKRLPFHSVIFDISIYSKMTDENGISYLGKKIDELEFIPGTASGRFLEFYREFRGVGMLSVYGFMNDQGYFSLGVSDRDLSYLFKYISELTALPQNGVLSPAEKEIAHEHFPLEYSTLIPLQIVFDPTRSESLEGRVLELPGLPYLLSVHATRY